MILSQGPSPDKRFQEVLRLKYNLLEGVVSDRRSGSEVCYVLVLYQPPHLLVHVLYTPSVHRIQTEEVEQAPR